MKTMAGVSMREASPRQRGCVSTPGNPARGPRRDAAIRGGPAARHCDLPGGFQHQILRPLCPARTPSGCGKSTLLKAVGGNLEPTEGEISLRGERVTHPGPDRMMVFQEFDQLLPWMSVLANVMFPLVETG
jgi:hypothetical protein